jgi:3-methyladenine DNA glycosylase AlkD
MTPRLPRRVSLSRPVADVLAWLKRTGTAKTRDGMARYGLPSDRALGVPVGALKARARVLGPSHDLALGLWETGWYEARLLAAFVGEPGELTPRQMDRWCRDFDNWGVVDTVCFALFDRSPHAWGRIEPWSRRKDEFGRRAAFALLACLALHDKAAADERFLRLLPIAERAASDGRNFVSKGICWALRAMARRTPALRGAVLELTQRLMRSSDAAARSLGRAMAGELSGRKAPPRIARSAARRR